MNERHSYLFLTCQKYFFAVCLLTVLFFLPFFQLWINEKILILIGGLYAFIFVPVTVGFVKPNLLEQQNFLFRLRRKCRRVSSRFQKNTIRFIKTRQPDFSISFADECHNGVKLPVLLNIQGEYLIADTLKVL